MGDSAAVKNLMMGEKEEVKKYFMDVTVKVVFSDVVLADSSLDIKTTKQINNKRIVASNVFCWWPEWGLQCVNGFFSYSS